MDLALRAFEEQDDAALQALIDDGETVTWAVATDGRTLGMVSVFAVDREQGTCQVGYGDGAAYDEHLHARLARDAVDDAAGEA